MKKRILFVVPSLGLGGAQKMAAQVAGMCINNGYDVSILSFDAGKIEVMIDDRINITQMGFVTKWEKPLCRVLLNLKAIKSELKRISPDIVIAFSALAAIGVVCSGGATKAKIIASERDDPYQMGVLARKIATNIYKRCDKLVFQTQGACDAYASTQIKEKCKIIPNPCTNSKLTSPVDVRNMTFVTGSRFAKCKRIDVIIEAFKIFSAKHKGYQLRIYGKGEEHKNLLELTEKAELCDAVKFCGSIPDFLSNERAACAFLFASVSEGIPNVLIEAMSYGIPVIAADCSPGGARFVLEDDKNGFIIPINDAGAMADAMEFVIENVDEVNKRRDSAIKSMGRFDIKNIEDKWISLVGGE